MHVEAITLVARQALDDAHVSPQDLDALAVTYGPGLAGSLLVGVNFAKGLAFGWNKPLIGVNHIEGHVYSLWLTGEADQIVFPGLCLIVSGGHTELLLMTDHGKYTMLGNTLDDAAGEALDNAGRDLKVGIGAASCRATAAEMLIRKRTSAAQASGATAIHIAGGVSATQFLREEMQGCGTIPVGFPPLKLCTDNAAMIAAAG